ncbi:hypothetical protein CYLTODRAFT_441924 [Cylindrobasidium torrendii FP15055 ss-10]|uniref:F-box domain-containing protein n=1 Tax=Cylindrobasidium torrendii FP15055 ss-10 TaxID=1314674 RepID=A0A0D7BLX2_9AGAR|nr:hypothetical protein CYLTODRAFT_441924 [Cylindrobasidium torrendii FP15055 ss-10]
MSPSGSALFAEHSASPRAFQAPSTRLASCIQSLPLDISRSILEWGAVLDRTSARRWLLVSQRVKQWLEPLLYHTVILRSELQKRNFMDNSNERTRWTRTLIWSESVANHDMYSPVLPQTVKQFESREDLIKSTSRLFASFQSLRSLVWYGAVEEMQNVLGVLGKSGGYSPSLRRLHVLLQPSPFSELAGAETGLAGLTHFSIGCCTFSSVEMEYCLWILKQTPVITHFAVVPMLAIGLDSLCAFATDVLEGRRKMGTEDEVACGATLRVFAVVLPHHVDKAPIVPTRDPRFAMVRSSCRQARVGEQRLGCEDRILGVDYDWRYPLPEERDVWEVAEDIAKAQTQSPDDGH